MATVNLRLRGGPFDGQVTTMEVQDPDNPPESYTARVHGPHEVPDSMEYRRSGREPDGGALGGIWIYEAALEPR